MSLFANLYEYFIPPVANYRLLFDHLFYNGGYNLFGWLFISIPIIPVVLFYFALKYPYTKLWHWGLLLVLIAVSVFSITVSQVNLELFASSKFIVHGGNQSFAEDIVWKYATLNTVLSLITTFLYSIIAKYFSKIQKHLPF